MMDHRAHTAGVKGL